MNAKVAATSAVVSAVTVGVVLTVLAVSTHLKRPSEPIVPVQAPVTEPSPEPAQKIWLGQPVSPDGNWLLTYQEIGRSPIGHGVTKFVHLVNLKDGPDRFVYMDWSERPEDLAYMSAPTYGIGWNADGTVGYLGSFGRDPLDADHPLPDGYWNQVGYVNSVCLDSKYTRCPTDSFSGEVLDFYPEKGFALVPTDSGIAIKPANVAVFTYPIDETSGDEGPPYDKRRHPTSAALSPDAASAVYVLSEDGKNDEAFTYDVATETTQRLDLKPYELKLKELGVREPYRLLVEHTFMNRKDDFFLSVVGKGGDTAVMRCLSRNFMHQDKEEAPDFSCDLSKDGAWL